MVKILLLNGVGSAGKSSIAKALRSVVVQPFMHVAMDDFLGMLPERYMDHDDGLRFRTSVTDGQTQTTVSAGVVMQMALAGMRRSVKALADAGNNLIVDEVIFGASNNGHSDALTEYRELLADHDLQFVGIFSSLKTLEQRERDRGDRQIGLARWQYDLVHEGMEYDFTVNTDECSALECAELIKTHFSL